MDKKMMIVIAIAVTVFIAGIAAAVVLKDNGDSDGVVDAAGNKAIAIDKVESITAASPSVADLVCYMGSGSLLKCVSTYCSNTDIPSTVSLCGPYSNPDTDAISTANSSLTILDASGSKASAAYTTLRDSGMENVYLFYGSDDGVDGIYKNITILGIILGVEDKATRIVDSMKEKVSNLESATKSADTSDVIITTGFGNCNTDSDGSFKDLSDLTSSVYAAGSDSTLLGLAKTVSNCATPLGGSSWSALDSDFIATKTADVEVLFILWTYGPDPTAEAAESFVNGLKGDTAWQDCKAVKEGNVFFLCGNAASDLSRNTPYTVDNLGILSVCFNPGCFSKTAEGPALTYGDLPKVINDDNVRTILDYTANRATA